MSHYTSIKLVCRNRASIVAALEALRFKATVHDDAVHLYGIGNHRRPEVANVVVHRRQICPGANDLGFVYNQNTGAYEMIISEFDQRHGDCFPGRGLGRSFQRRFVEEYAVAEIERDGRYVITDRRRTADGRYQIELKPALVYEGVGLSETTDSSSFANYEV